MATRSISVIPITGWIHPLRIAPLVLAITLGFSFLQNAANLTGGPISFPKALWLSLTLQMFFVMPFLLWRNPRIHPDARRIFGAVFGSFAVRGILELIILYFTRGWRCGYGIAHDVFTFALAAFLFSYCSRDTRDALTRRTLYFLPMLLVTLVVEMFMAWKFSLLASPAAGIYFADDSAHFRSVNLASWAAVAVGYPVLGLFLWKTRKDFAG